MKKLREYIQNIRMDKAKKELQNGNVLDLGCGATIDYLVSGIKDYTGIDYNINAIKYLRKKYPQYNFKPFDLNYHFIMHRMYDNVLLIATIEHIFNQGKLFESIVYGMNKNSKLIITTPTPLGDFIHGIGAKLGLLSRKADGEHIVIYNKHRFKIIAKQYGLQIIKYKTFELGCNQLVVMKLK